MRVSVTELAEFVHRRGDIHYPHQSATLAQEGIARQKSYQQDRGESYRRERSVSATFGELEISGRIDGWDAEARLVEEVKTTRGDPGELHAHAGDVHLAQLRLYGALLVLSDEVLDELRLRLVYLHPVNPGETVFDETAGREDLIGYFEGTCAIYAAWIANVRDRVRARNRQLAALGFPYEEFRADQRRIAKHLYRGFRDGVDWLVEAPTGSGKTMAGLFAALKAMAADELDRLVFLTSRTTGQRAVEDALGDVGGAIGADTAVVAVTVTAKDRICFGPGPSCDPARCEFAIGYYQRMPAARRQLLGRGLVRRGDVETVAREHGVCPFQLAHDVAEWADVVVCDYNHVFDPIARLGGLKTEAFSRVGLIVDEAHQLGDRVGDMLGSTVSRRTLKRALAEGELAESLAKGLRSADRALAALARGVSDEDEECQIPKPVALLRAIERLLAGAPEVKGDAEGLATSAVLFDLFRFGYLAGDAAESNSHYLARGNGRELQVELVCTVPGNHIQECLARFQGSARVSGSLTPPSVFQHIHGAQDSPNVLVSNGSFPPEHLGVLVVSDISTYYRDRERTLTRVVELITGVCSQTHGNYLVALPSFEYAEAVANAMAEAHCRCQRPGMDLDEREDFINWLSEPGSGRTGVVVMGGVFAESVDFDGGALDGVVVVGAGLPPRSLRRDLVGSDNARPGVDGDGDEIAYRQPAMTRVVQAAGRVVRSAQDRGIVVLVDPRFSSRAYRDFMPGRWRIRSVPSGQVPTAVRCFWRGHDDNRDLDRLRDGQRPRDGRVSTGQAIP